MVTAVKPEATEKLMTAEEAFALSTVNRRFEVVKGVYQEMSPAGGQHGEITNWIAFLVTEYVLRNGLGKVAAAETGFILSRRPDTVRAADVAFISKARLQEADPPIGYWTIAPDLAVEVVSPNESPDDVQEKVQDYLAAGTRMIWLVYPKTRSITVYRSLKNVKVLREDELLSGEEVLPGFERRVSEIFQKE